MVAAGENGVAVTAGLDVLVTSGGIEEIEPTSGYNRIMVVRKKERVMCTHGRYCAMIVCVHDEAAAGDRRH